MQWGVNGATNGSIDVNGNMIVNNLTVNGTLNSIWTNSGVANLSAIATQLVSITGMNGNAWSFKKPTLWATNAGFSATAKVSLFDNSTLYGDNEVWRNEAVALGSSYNTAALPLGTNVITVVDATPFSTLAKPFQVNILDSTTNEFCTVTNVSGSDLQCVWPTKYPHAISNVISHACSLNVPGWVNDESAGNTLRLYIGFSAAQTVGVGYQFKYIRVR